MAVYKLLLENDELENLDSKVIAIHTLLEDSRLAFFLNKILNIKLFKSINDIKIADKKEEDTFFGSFIFEDETNEIFWNLIQNENETITSTNQSNQGLFASSENTFLKKVYFLPEYKKANFILKIDGSKEAYAITDIINKINSIERVSTVYEIDMENLKSKNNLIF